MLNEVKHLKIRFFAGACPEEVEGAQNDREKSYF